MITTNPFTTENYMKAVDELKAIIAKQDAEIERLRKALEKISRTEPESDGNGDWYHMIIARDALQQKDSE